MFQIDTRRLACPKAGGKGEGQVVAAADAVDVKDLPGKEKSPAAKGCKGGPVHLGEGNPARTHLGPFGRAGARHREAAVKKVLKDRKERHFRKAPELFLVCDPMPPKEKGGHAAVHDSCEEIRCGAALRDQGKALFQKRLRAQRESGEEVHGCLDAGT